MFCDNAKCIELINVFQMSIRILNKLVDAFNKWHRVLKNGEMYISFKYSYFDEIIVDRYFTYLIEKSITILLIKFILK